MKKALLIFCLMLFFALFNASAYQLVLKDGRTIQGKLISETESIVILKDATGLLLNFKKSDIDSQKTAELNKQTESAKPKEAFLDGTNVHAPRPKRASHVVTKEELEALRKKYDLGQGSYGEAYKLEFHPIKETIEPPRGKNSEFNEQVLDSEIPVIVDFWASWCGPCRKIAPSVEEVEEEFEGKAKVYRVNIDEQESLARDYQIEAIPTLLFMKDGQIVDRTVGVISKDTITSKLKSLLQ